jgi:hypothetical protein
VDIVNIYDPMDRIVYRHLDQRRHSYSVATTSADTVNQMPSGYANSSPRTYLRPTRRTSQAA